MKEKNEYGAKIGTAHGSSGSAVFNENYEVIGVYVSSIYEDKLDFFIPIEYAENVYKQWRATGQ